MTAGGSRHIFPLLGTIFMFHWLRKAFNHNSTTHAPRASRRALYPLFLETLEDRLTPSATQVAFTTAPTVTIAGQPSTTVIVQLEDANGIVAKAGPAGVTISLTSNSGGAGKFFLDTGGNVLSSPTLFIAQGGSSASFKYEDNRMGTPALTAAAASVGSATQQEAIDADLGVYGLNDDMTAGTLRYAITHATAGQTIAFAPGVFGTIQLTSLLPFLATSVNIIGPNGIGGNDLGDGKTLAIDGSGVGAGNSGLLGFASGATVTITDLSVIQANSTGISNDGVLTLERVVVSGNQASALASSAPFGAAGGIYNDGTLTVQRCSITENSSSQGLGAAGIDNEPKPGGGIATISDSLISNRGTGIVNSGTMTLNRDVIQGNNGSLQHSFGAGGGIYNSGMLAIAACTVDGNIAFGGDVAAGIDSVAGAVTIGDSTVSDNTANDSNRTGGIGIYGGTLVIANSTVVHNSTYGALTSGGGIDANGASTTIFDTIVANNISNGGNLTDVSGTFTSSGHNWIGTADSHSSGFVASDTVGTSAAPKDPKLDSALNYEGGWPTPTFEPLPGSPVIDAGDNTNAPATDQRGLPRIANGIIDVGADEFQILLNPSTLHPAQVGASYYEIISGVYGTPPYTFAVTAGALPAGLLCYPDGRLYGTPTAGGTFTFTVTATDSSTGTAYTGSSQYTLLVMAPVITFMPIPPSTDVNTAYSQQLTGAGGTAPYSNFTLSAGTLPPGIALSATGLLSGTPTVAGVFTFTVSVTDSSGGAGPYTGGHQLDIVVTPPGFSFPGGGTFLKIIGYLAQNNFTYAQASSVDSSGSLHTTYTFSMNGVTLSVPDTLVTEVEADGYGNSGTAILVTNDTYQGADDLQHETSQSVALGFGYAEIRAPHITVDIGNFYTIYAYVGRADTGTFYATGRQGESNIFVTAGSYSYVSAPGQYYEISGARTVYGYTSKSTDQAWHYDTAALDSFVVSGNAYSYMSGTDNGLSFFNEAVGFSVSYGIATHGQSVAYMIDSPGNDVFAGYATYSDMSGSDSTGLLFNVAEGFALVYAESFVGGTDYAYNYDSTHNVLNSQWILLT